MTICVLRSIIIYVEGVNIIAEIKDILDWQIYYKKDGKNGEEVKIPGGYEWTNTKEPLTLRNVYPHLKTLFEKKEKKEEKGLNKPKSSMNVQKIGHRKQMFSESQKKEIYEKYAYENVPIRTLAREYKCSPKTIRNVINYVRMSALKKE